MDEVEFVGSKNENENNATNIVNTTNNNSDVRQTPTEKVASVNDDDLPF